MFKLVRMINSTEIVITKIFNLRFSVKLVRIIEGNDLIMKGDLNVMNIQQQ